jgi:hypothetical protein
VFRSLTNDLMCSPDRALLCYHHDIRGELTKERIMNKQSTPRKTAKINESTAATLAPTDSSRRKLATQAFESSSFSPPSTHSIPQKKPASNAIATAELAASATVTVSKQTRIIAMLQQSDGATLADLMTITGWQSATQPDIRITQTAFTASCRLGRSA